MKRIFLVALALLAVYMGKRALRRENEIAKLLWALLAATALSTASTPKTRSVETRLNSLVPQVFANTGGTINGNTVMNGNHTVNGAQAVNGNVTVSGNLNGSGTALKNTNGIHSSASVQADGNVIAGGQLLVNGASGGATAEVVGNGHFTTDLQADNRVIALGQLLVGGASSSATLAVAGNAHITSGVQIDGTLNGGPVVVGGQGAVSPVTGGTPSSYNTTWAGQVGSAINGIINRLNASGLT